MAAILWQQSLNGHPFEHCVAKLRRQQAVNDDHMGSLSIDAYGLFADPNQSQGVNGLQFSSASGQMASGLCLLARNTQTTGAGVAWGLWLNTEHVSRGMSIKHRGRGLFYESGDSCRRLWDTPQ
jgi:hypothetical protein